MLVLMDSLFPGLGNQYAAIGAWDTQLTAIPVSADRPSNLEHAADDDLDAGSHGIFDDKAGGVLDPSFVRSLPATAVTFVRAMGRTVQDVQASRKARSADGTTAPSRSGGVAA